MREPWVLKAMLLAACCGWAATMAYYWRRVRFLERLAQSQHESIVRMAGPCATERAITIARIREMN